MMTAPRPASAIARGLAHCVLGGACAGLLSSSLLIALVWLIT